MTSFRTPPLNAIRAFESAARLGSFVAAAMELHVTQPAVGRHIRLLEDRLKVPLFERTPRGVVLTATGRTYFDQVHVALEMIDRASIEVAARGRQKLHMLVAPGFASRWLLERLPEFRAMYPEINIALEANASFTSLASSNADLGIAFGERASFGTASESLVRPPIFPVCAPSLLVGRKAPEHACDLLDLPLLHEDDGGWWSSWFHRVGVEAKPVAKISYESSENVMQLAIAGQGVALTNSFLLADELSKGRLVRPVSDTCVLEGYVLLAPAKGLTANARCFKNWVIAAAAEHVASVVGT